MSRQLTAALLTAALAAACNSSAPSQSQKALPKSASPDLAVNGGFENGTLSGWKVDAFTNPTTGVANFPPTSETDLNLSGGGTATSSAVTSLLGINLGTLAELGLSGGLHFPIFGSWSALVNDQSSSNFGHANNVNKISQTYTVTAADIDPSDGQIHVRLVVAPILEDGGHPASQQPYVFIQAVNTTKGTVIGTDFTSANQAGINWQRQTSPLTGQPVVYTAWRLVDFAPGNAALQVGDSVFVEIVAAGCATGSHVGEVLVDSVGPAVPGLSVSTTGASQVNNNSNITYNHAVHNGGVLANTNVTVTQPVIPGTSYVSVNAPVTASCVTPTIGATSGNVVCNMGTVNAAATANLKVTLKAPAATGTLLNANAKVTADGGVSLNANQVVSNVVSSVLFADVKLTIDDGIAALNWGGTTTYAVTVTNAGPAAAPAVTLTIPPPLNATNTAWTCTPNAGGPLVVTLPLPGLGPLVSVFSMPANSSVNCSYTAHVVAGSGPGTLSLSGTAADLTTINPTPADGTAADQDQLSGSLINITVAKDAAGNGSGVVVSAPAQINCGATCTGQFVPGVSIALTATSNAGSQFSGWSGTFCNGSALPVCVFTPTADTTITARFDKLTFPITTSVVGSGTLVCPAFAVQGALFACTVTPAVGFQLSSLTDNGVDVTAQVLVALYTKINVQEAHALVATFVKSNGILCTTSDECGSGICTDGVCCATACNGQCQACNLLGSLGVCLAVTVGLPPVQGHPGCGGTGVCAGTCDGLNVNSCSFPGVGTQCTAASCTNGIETLPASCQGDGACPVLATQSCGAFACGATTCNTTCNGDGDCASGNFCNSAHACVPKEPLAGACTAGDQCGSGNCVDGVCCNTACNTGQCSACDVTGLVGICSPVLTGQPHGNRTACTGNGTTCGGSCDLLAAGGACDYPGSGVQCAPPSCTNGVETLAASCANNGTCAATTTQSCGNYTCGATACNTTCNGDGDCISGDFCNSAHACVPKQPQAGTCTSNNQCGTGSCVDGVCCDTACGGQCQACDVAGHAGTCTTLTSGEPHGLRTTCAGNGSLCGGTCDGASATQCDFPGPATQCAPASCTNGVATIAVSCNALGACASVTGVPCGPFACNAGGTACNVLCGGDADCASSAFCNDLHQCVPKKDPGPTATCTKDDQCGSGHCTDGFCCDTACNGQCQACDVPGSQGTCTADTAGDAPHGSRAACATDGSLCGGSCDGTHTASCTFPGSGTACRDGSCTAGTATLAAACDGAGSCPAAQTQSCSPFTCGATACQGNCSADTDCSSGDFCAAGICTPKKAPGATCSATDQCGTGFCVDGLCCDTSCDGQCQACNVAGKGGTCSPVAGNPVGARSACNSDGSSCGGTCDGTHGNACAFPGTDISCRAGSCSGNTAVMAASCNGAGACPAEQDVSCGTSGCGTGSTCAGGCTADNDCGSGNFCAAGVCTPQKSPGGSCSAADQCTGGNCVDGVCCNTSCDGQCAACDVPGSVGTCSPIAAGGAPHGARQACATDGSTCGGVCDGTTTASCGYPGAGTSCRDAACSANVATLGASCDGAGKCPALQTQGCNPFTCGATACKGNCGSDNDCTAGNFCAAGVCQPKLPNGTTSSTADQCQSGIVVDGVCCNAACDGQCEACNVAGSVGTCSAVTGAPQGSRTACATDGSTCGGSCDGQNRNACAFAGTGTVCRGPSCTDGVATASASCNAAGACGAKTQTSCGAFGCSGNACAASCTSDSQCATGSTCVAGACVAAASPVITLAGTSGCSSGGGSLAPIVGMVLFALFRMRKRRSIAAAAVLAVASASSAQSTLHTSSDLVVDRFQPGTGALDILSVGSAQTQTNGDLHLSVFYDYANQPLRIITAGTASNPQQQFSVLRYQSMLYLGASMAFFDRLELGLQVPMLVAQGIGSGGPLGNAFDASGAGIGDLRVLPKLKILDRDKFALAIAAPIALPTGAGHSWLSQGSVTAQPQLRFDTSQELFPVQFALNAGVMLRTPRQLVDLTLHNAFTYGAGAEYPFKAGEQKLAALATFAGEIGLGESGGQDRPMEAMGGLKWLLPAGVTLLAGGGPGLTNGYGTPRFRVFASFSYEPREREHLVYVQPVACVAPPAAPLEQRAAIIPVLPAPAPEPAPVVEPAPAPAVALPLPEPTPAPAPVETVRNGKVVLLAGVQFETSKAVLLASSLPILDKVVKALNENPDFGNVRVEGYTDNAGSAKKNLKLSQARAEAVRGYLIANGISPYILTAKGYGAENPVATNTTVEGRQLNRRVEFVTSESSADKKPALKERTAGMGTGTPPASH